KLHELLSIDSLHSCFRKESPRIEILFSPFHLGGQGRRTGVLHTPVVRRRPPDKLSGLSAGCPPLGASKVIRPPARTTKSCFRRRASRFTVSTSASISAAISSAGIEPALPNR